MDDRKKVAIKFDEIASQYDNQRRELIPCFEEFYSIPVTIADINDDSPNILDIGAGTGLFSAFMLKKYPNANLTLIDISEKMLEVAKSRFLNHPNVKYITDDYTKYNFDETYDLVISSLSIHHLTNTEKKDLYRHIFTTMKSNSLFINADQVLGDTPYLDSLYKEEWRRKVENSKLSKEEILNAYERTKLDKMSTLDEQLNWLKEIGFTDLDCIYKNFNFVVILGRKPFVC
ncbi:class I SAM-dependent methyltransferase [Ammoniphilus sp. YIM 78166]|uniref:class I SAM-dependent methyltransferase n=1 Tax=Ammoniphilus sp. YIM 78166 TaxID=1644106 RepID=UPI00106F9446|nr:class I SAM-dependent methyltransferase [Ammoniphilus sp. YIM 78166]